MVDLQNGKKQKIVGNDSIKDFILIVLLKSWLKFNPYYII